MKMLNFYYAANLCSENESIKALKHTIMYEFNQIVYE